MVKILGVMGFGLLVACGGGSQGWAPDPSQAPRDEALDGGGALPDPDARADAPTPRHDAGMVGDETPPDPPDSAVDPLIVCKASACEIGICGQVTSNCNGSPATFTCAECGMAGDGTGYMVCGDNSHPNQCGDACADRIELRQAGFCAGHGFAPNYLTKYYCTAPYKVDRFTKGATPTFHPGETSGCVIEVNAAYGDFLCCP